MRSSSAARAGVLLALALASGAAALAVETCWLRWLRLRLGATAPAAAATLSAVLLGQALGSLAAARLAPGWRRPLRAFATLVWIAALACLAVPGLLDALDALPSGAYERLAERPAALFLLRFATALAATLGAASLLGAALPALAAAWLAEPAQLASRGTLLYATSLFGGALGAALAAFVLPERIGVQASYQAAVASLALAGAVAWAVGRRDAPRAQSPTPARAAPAHAPLSRRALLWLAAGSGFASLAFQILLVRALALVLDQSAYAFGALLVCVHVALALGSLAVAGLCGRLGWPPAAVAAVACACAALGALLFPRALYVLTDGLAFAPPAPGGLAALAPALRLTAASAGPTLLAAGMLLPALLAAASALRDAAPEALLGRLLALNTLGAIAGALCAPFVLLHWLTPWSACVAVGALYAAVGVLLPMPDRRLRLARDLALALGWIGVLRAADPLSLPLLRLAPGEAPLYTHSGPAGLVAVVARGEERVIRTDNHLSLAGTADRVHQERQGLLAWLLHPTARRIAWIGSASGISAGPLTGAPLEELALVEITPGVSEAAERFFGAANRGVHRAPGTRSVLDDARNFVRATSARYDLIVADLFVPWHEGVGALYTREHFDAVRARLLPDGVFVQWLPLYQHDAASFESLVATFLDSFPRAALFRGDFFARFPIVALVGFAGRPPAAETIARATRALAARGETDRWVTTPTGAFALYAGSLDSLRAALAATPRHSDDRPRIEWAAARAGLQRGGAPGAFVGAQWIHFVARLEASALRAGDDIFPDLAHPARRASSAGALLQAASSAYVEGRAEDAAQLLHGAAVRLPASLLDPQHPDPSAAEVWPQ